MQIVFGSIAWSATTERLTLRGTGKRRRWKHGIETRLSLRGNRGFLAAWRKREEGVARLPQKREASEAMRRSPVDEIMEPRTGTKQTRWR